MILQWCKVTFGDMPNPSMPNASTVEFEHGSRMEPKNKAFIHSIHGDPLYTGH